MNDVPNTHPDPIHSGQPPEPDAASPSKRPLGTLVIAAFLTLIGVIVPADLYSRLSPVLSSAEITLHPSSYAILTRESITAVTAILGAIALVLGWRLGWWLSFVHAYWQLSIKGILPLFGAAVSFAGGNGRPEANAITWVLIRSAVFLLIALYLQKSNVLSYFGVTVRRSVVNVVVLVLCVTIAFGLDLWWAAVQD